MKYVKSTVKKADTKQTQEEKPEHEPARKTMHNTTKMWKGLVQIILISVLVTVIFFAIQICWILIKSAL